MSNEPRPFDLEHLLATIDRKDATESEMYFAAKQLASKLREFADDPGIRLREPKTAIALDRVLCALLGRLEATDATKASIFCVASSFARAFEILRPVAGRLQIKSVFRTPEQQRKIEVEALEQIHNRPEIKLEASHNDVHDEPSILIIDSDEPLPAEFAQIAAEMGFGITYAKIVWCDACGLIECACDIIKDHREDCRYRIATTCPIAFACEAHKRDVCPICDACTCNDQPQEGANV